MEKSEKVEVADTTRADLKQLYTMHMNFSFLFSSIFLHYRTALTLFKNFGRNFFSFPLLFFTLFHFRFSFCVFRFTPRNSRNFAKRQKFLATQTKRTKGTKIFIFRMQNLCKLRNFFELKRLKRLKAISRAIKGHAYHSTLPFRFLFLFFQIQAKFLLERVM